MSDVEKMREAAAQVADQAAMTIWGEKASAISAAIRALPVPDVSEVTKLKRELEDAKASLALMTAARDLFFRKATGMQAIIDAAASPALKSKKKSQQPNEGLPGI